jgi:hypothetical protein
MSQEGVKGDLMNGAPGPCKTCDRGVDSSQLYGGPACEGCDSFDDVYVDHCRDVAYSDMLHSDYTNVLSTTWNQVYDTRGPVDCNSGACGSCPEYYFEGLYGRNNCNPDDNWLFTTPTRGTRCISDNKPVRTTGY